MSDERCTPRKHLVERGKSLCDCAMVLVTKTAAHNALVVTILDSVQRESLTTWAANDGTTAVSDGSEKDLS